MTHLRAWDTWKVTVLETTRASLRLLNRRDRRLLALAVTVQMSTAILDFVGVTLIGLAGTLSFAMVAENLHHLSSRSWPRLSASVSSPMRGC